MSILLRHAAASTTAPPVNYIEDVFSTYLYTGNGSTQTITNGIDLSTKGGLTWIKARTNTSGGATAHVLVDTVRGSSKWLSSDATSSETTNANLVTGFTTSGFSVGNAPYWGNENTIPYASWTFREQAKFFDIVTYTGTGAVQNIAHNLGSVPGCIIVKRTDTAGFDWPVYHRSTGNTDRLLLNDTVPSSASSGFWNNTTPTSSVFTVGSNVNTNGSGGTYVAYLFAHDAGGFGLTGTDNVISCGSVVGSSQVEVNLGYEPQWILVKNASAAQDWWLVDNMRGLPVQATDTSYNASNLRPHLSDAETTGFSIAPSATGFKANVLTSGQTYIYIAIRRGPMKVPTTGTSVYNAIARNGNMTNTTVTGMNFPPDLVIPIARVGAANSFWDRLRGRTKVLVPNAVNAEATYSDSILSYNMNGISVGTDNAGNDGWINTYGSPGYINYFMGRAPSFFDEVCYTGTGANTTQSHNLGAVPELIIVKSRSAATEAEVYVAPLGNDSALNLFGAVGAAFLTGGIAWNYTTPTASVFSLGTWNKVNGSGVTFVAYLFATCPGVSKVGTYTGNGTTQTIACGFAAGARFILIKRTDSTGGWFVWDTSRGIVAGNDPYLLLNSAAAEVTTNDSIDPDASGFIVNQIEATDINVTSASYIFLAIA